VLRRVGFVADLHRVAERLHADAVDGILRKSGSFWVSLRCVSGAGVMKKRWRCKKARPESIDESRMNESSHLQARRYSACISLKDRYGQIRGSD
jgi:hypothetical protein